MGGGLSPWPMGLIGNGVGPLWDCGAKAILGSNFHFGQELFNYISQNNIHVTGGVVSYIYRSRVLTFKPEGPLDIVYTLLHTTKHTTVTHSGRILNITALCYNFVGHPSVLIFFYACFH